ncbi:hypothetical protein JCM15415_19460 [Methanobacterium movens]
MQAQIFSYITTRKKIMLFNLNLRLSIIGIMFIKENDIIRMDF